MFGHFGVCTGTSRALIAVPLVFRRQLLHGRTDAEGKTAGVRQQNMVISREGLLRCFIPSQQMHRAVWTCIVMPVRAQIDNVALLLCTFANTCAAQPHFAPDY